MVPLGLAPILAWCYVYYETKAAYAAAGAGAIAAVILWTVLAMGEDISALRGTPQDVYRTARQFCGRHHLRTVVSGATFAWAIWEVVVGMKKKC